VIIFKLLALEVRILFYKWAKRNMPATHIDLPEVILKLAELDYKYRATTTHNRNPKRVPKFSRTLQELFAECEARNGYANAQVAGGHHRRNRLRRWIRGTPNAG